MGTLASAVTVCSFLRVTVPGSLVSPHFPLEPEPGCLCAATPGAPRVPKQVMGSQLHPQCRGKRAPLWGSCLSHTQWAACCLVGRGSRKLAVGWGGHGFGDRSSESKCCGLSFLSNKLSSLRPSLINLDLCGSYNKRDDK